MYNYRKSTNSTVNRYSSHSEDDFVITMNYIYKYVINKPKIFMEAYYARIIRYISAALACDYFHVENKESKKEKFARLEKLLNSEPFSLGMKNVNKMNLYRKHRYMMYLLKHKLYIILYYMYRLNNYIKNKKYL